jgi:dipeptidyl aminopeptidase/acylaminoacyl peptidase
MCTSFRRTCLFATAFVGAVLSVFPSRANEPAGDQRKSLTPEAAISLRALSDLELSPDGSRLAFVVTEPPKGEHRLRHIWLYDKQTNSVRQFTASTKSETSPRWSPDGKQLAFLSNRDDQQQIFLMRTDGGEATAITKGKRSVSHFAWSPDGKQIAFLAPDPKSEAEEKKEKDKDDAHVVDKEDKPPRLWLLTLATGDVKALTESKWAVQELVWHPSGSGLFLSATDHPESDQNTNRIFAFRLSDNSLTQVLAPRGPFGRLRAAPEGQRFAFIGCREDGPSPHDLMIGRHGDRVAGNITGASLDRPVFDYSFTADGGFLLAIGDGFLTKFVGFAADGSRKDPAGSLTLSPAAFAVARSGEVFFSGQTATQPQELYAWDQKGAPERLSHFNDAWEQFALVAPERYKYKSFDGQEIEAALLKPSGYDGRSKLPLIALIHGGPTGAWQDNIEVWGQLLVAHGYAIFYPNIRGSTGYGQKFIESNRGDWGGGDFKDVMAGVHELVNRGIADPARLGIGGWSYGGYMSEWAITQTTEFKAAVSGAGLSNLISEYGTEQGPSYDEWFYGLPYEPDKVAGFLNSSPFTQLKNAKTPTLILQGDSDVTDPIGQSQELYRGLKRYGVETELVVYPREGHGLQEEKHLVDRLNRILAWYDKHLKPPAEERPGLKKDVPAGKTAPSLR